MCRRICLLCQQTLLENMNMTSNYDVTNSAHQIQITTICHWMKPPPLQFYAYSLVLARSRERLNNPPVLRVWSMIPSSCGKACARRAEKNMPNNVGARTQPSLTPLQIGKVSDMEPSNWTLAFMFSWNATSSVSGQPNSLSMLYKPDRLTVSKALVRPMKTTYSGRDCSTLFSWSCLSQNTMSDVLLEGRKSH